MFRRDFRRLLRDVSRSFYLSIRFLPKENRDPVGLAYLLARISDTLADTASVPIELRKSVLEEFRKLALEGGDSNLLCQKIESEFSPHQSKSSEVVLLKNIPACLDFLASLDEESQAAIREVLSTITDGQLWDLDPQPVPLDDAALENYTYAVAGCVGEFWTRVGFLNLDEKFADPAEKENLMRDGRDFGKALQLINILRDVGEDWENGRCYLPGISVEDDREHATTELIRWQSRCRELLKNGWRYLEKIRDPRTRFATALPLIIGEKTLALLEKAGPEVFNRRVKISRSDVKKILLRAWWHRKRTDKLRALAGHSRSNRVCS